MDKLKNVLAHGSKKGEHGEGSHLEHAHQGHDASTPAKGGEEYHPIYDQFARTGQSTTGDASAHNSTLRQDAIRGKPGHPFDENSTASIKSGVAGLPQGHQQTVPDRSAGLSSNEHALAHTEVPPLGLHRQKDYDDLRTTSTGASAEKSSTQPFERSLQEPVVATDTDREFPLAGGVTSRKHDHTPDVSTNEREPGTKGRDLGGSHSHGREALAGAAAAYATSGRHSEGPLSSEHKDVPGHRDETGHSGHGGEALAGATSAYMASSANKADSKPTQSVKFAGGSPDPYDPCASDNKPPQSTTFTSGPHRTDTANRIDPHLHVPGEFPETPMETPGERGQGTGSYVSATDRHLEGSMAERSATTPNDSAPFGNKSVSENPARSDDHTGRNAAVVGAAGAAALGAYGAGKHHQSEPTDTESEIPASANPYSSKKIDPRVDSTPAKYDAQRFDPAVPTQPSPHASEAQSDHLEQSEAGVPSYARARDLNEVDHHDGKAAASAVGASAGGLAYGASRHGDEVSPSANQQSVQTSQNVQSARSEGIASQDHDTTRYPEHHYGRNASLGAAGVGAAGAGYYATPSHGDDRAAVPQDQDNYPNAHQRYDSVQEPLQKQTAQSESHDRNVPARTNLAAGGVAVAAGAGAGYAYAQHDSPEAEKQRLAQQKAQEKEMEHRRQVQQKELEKQQKQEQKELERQQKHDRKAHEKELEKQQKHEQKEAEKKEKEHQKALIAHQKEVEKEQEKEKKHHDKLVAAEDKAHQKEAEKQQHTHQKEIEKENARLQKEKEKEEAHEGKEKKHHLFGFLHHKDKKESPERSPRTSKEYAGEGQASQDEYGSRRSSGSHEGRNKLHKDPPHGHPARQALEQQKREEEMAREESLRHPVQVPRNDALHSGVYENPSHHGKAEGENIEGHRNLVV